MKDMSSHIKLAGLLAGLEQRSMGLYDSTDALGSSSVTDRMQHVLYLLFEDYIRIDKIEASKDGTGRSRLLSSLRLMRLALDKFKGVFYKDGICFLPFYYARIFMLLSSSSLSLEIDSVVDSLLKLVKEASSRDYLSCCIICDGTADLITDVTGIVKGLAHGYISEASSVILSCWKTLPVFKTGPSNIDRQTYDRTSQICVSSKQTAIVLASTAAIMLKHLFQEQPVIASMHVPPETAIALCDLLLFAETMQQVSLFEGICAICCNHPHARLVGKRLCFSILKFLDRSSTNHFYFSQECNGRQVEFVAQLLWWQGLASCFESIVKQLAESGDLKDMACQCLGGLGKAVHGCSLPCNIQATFLSTMAMVLEFQPSLVTMAMPSVCAVVAVICDGGPCTSMVYWRAILPILRCAAEEDQRCGMIKIGHLKKSSGSLTCQLRRLIRTNVYPEDNMAHALEKLSVAQLLALGLQKAGYDIRTECGSCAEAWMKWALANQETLALEEVMGVLELRELVIVSDVCPVPEEIPRGGCDKLSILDLAWSTAFTSSFTSERREPGRQALARIMSLHCNVLMWINAASKQMSTQEELLAIARSCQSSIHRCISDSHELVRAAAISVTPLVTLGIGAAKHCLTRSLAPNAQEAIEILQELISDESLAVRVSVSKSLATLQAWISSGQHIKMFSWQKYATYLLDSLSFYLHTMAGKLGHDHIFIVVDYTLAGFISTISRFADSECQSGTCCEIAFEPLDLQPFNSLLMDVNKGPQVQHELLIIHTKWILLCQPEEAIVSSSYLLQQSLLLGSDWQKSVLLGVAQIIPMIILPRVLSHEYHPESRGVVKDYELKLLKELRHHVEHAKELCKHRIHVSLLTCIAQVCAATQTRDVLWMGLLILVDALDGKSLLARSRSAELLHAVALHRGVPLAAMIMQQPRIMEYIGRRLKTKPGLLISLTEALEVKECRLTECLVPAVLPRLVISQDVDLLETLAVQLGLSLKDMLVHYGHHTVAYILLEGTHNIDEYASFMFQQTEVEFDDLMRSSLRSVLREVIWSSGDEKRWPVSSLDLPGSGLQPSQDLLRHLQTNVLGCLVRIHMSVDVQEPEMVLAIANFLQEEQMVWLLTDLVGDRMKRPSKSEPTEQAHALRCLLLLVIFIDAHLSNFVPLVMTLLSRALELSAEEVRIQALAVWTTFIRQLSYHAPDVLKINAVRIAVILSSSFEEGGAVEQSAALAMEELILKNRDQLDKLLLCELPPLPSVPALQAVIKVISEARGDMSSPDQLQTLAHGLVPSRPEHYAAQPLSVKAVTLMEIKHFLQRNQDWRRAIAKQQNRAHTLSTWYQALNFLMAVLLKSCDPEVRSALSYRVQLRCGECLGVVGAVDPAKLDNVDNLRVVISKAQSADKLCHSERDLVQEVLKSLARLLSGSSDLEVLEAATFGIQELLHHFGGASHAPDEWTLFSAAGEGLQPVLRPYLSTKYQLQHTFQPSTSSPIFGSEQLSFRRWLFLWLRQLSDSTSAERSIVFQACAGVARHDIHIMMLLLPYAVLVVVGTGDPKLKELVTTEVNAVLQLGAMAEAPQADWQLFLQAIFTLLDKLNHWSARMENQGLLQSASSKTPGQPENSQTAFLGNKEAVDDFLKSIDKRKLARAAFRCGAYARAAQCFESALREEKGNGLNPAVSKNSLYDEEEVSFLINIYSELEEPDGLSGLIRLRKGGPTCSDIILTAERSGAWAEALTLHEQVLQHESAPTELPLSWTLSANQEGHIDCLLGMGHLKSVLTQVEGLALHVTGIDRLKLATKGIAAAWRLGRWEVMESCLQVLRSEQGVLHPDTLWEMRLSEILASIHRNDSAAVISQLKTARYEIMSQMAASAMESFSRAYPQVVRLHMLQEIEDVTSSAPGPCSHVLDVTAASKGDKRQHFHSQWPDRLACTRVSLATQEPILAIRRQLASLYGFPEVIGDCWLLQAKLCRKTGHLDTAAIACLEAVACKTDGALLEHAKLLWKTGEVHRAMHVVQAAISQKQERPVGTYHDHKAKNVDAKLLLQLARWMAETGQGGKDQVIAHFHNAMKANSAWEKSYFYFGRYLDQLAQDAKLRQHGTEAPIVQGKDRLGGKSKVVLGEEEHYLETLPDAIKNYALAVKHGHKMIMQSLPRLLTLWYDFGKHTDRMAAKAPSRSSPSEQQVFKNATEKIAHIMEEAAELIPLYSWLMVLSQLISRTGHSNPEVAGLTRKIVTSVTETYPQQCLWALVSVSRSKYKQRSKAAAEIINRAKKNIIGNQSRKKKDDGIKCIEVFNQFPAFVDQLINIANYVPENRVKRFDLTRDGGLGHVTRMSPYEVVLPVLDMLTPELPASGVADHQHNAFGGQCTTISGISKEVEVMQSLQKPKKIGFRGSDGANYTFLAKPKDDLRKDQRLMELATGLNRLFARHPSSRHRNLYVRTFNVVPLTEDCGIIQWVNCTQGLRHCCSTTYTSLGLHHKHTLQQIKQMYDRHDKSMTRKWTKWYDEVTEMFPPVLHKWFLKSFSTPSHWSNARLRFTRTTAVWSMVGHILGLGDRHGENLLIDRSTGDCVHVDFSCLFDKGLTLERPEMVPFRLTQNLIDAFGPTGVEGVFRVVCGTTLQVLRLHKDTILSILETFVHDPLVEWDKSCSPKGVGPSHAHGTGDFENPQARDALRTTEGRLDGTLIGVQSRPSLALSPEGHAHRLIEEAIDHENLGKMYVWWMIWY